MASRMMASAGWKQRALLRSRNAFLTSTPRAIIMRQQRSSVATTAAINDGSGGDARTATLLALAAGAAAALTAVLSNHNENSSGVECCGIAGVVGTPLSKHLDARYVHYSHMMRVLPHQSVRGSPVC